MKKLLILLRRIAFGLIAAILIAVPASIWLWQDRPAVSQIGLDVPEITETGAEGLRVTWLGTSTLLFDDGDTQILVDGFFSRPDIFDIVFLRPVSSNAATINYALDEFRIRRLAAIIPVHSHYDHAMDIGAIANRTSAAVVGTESTANIARGARVPEEQIVLATNGDTFTFGDFTVTLITTRHVPNGFGDRHLLAGFMSEPVTQPADITAWREGGSWSILISHPAGNTLVQGSAGYIENALDDVEADVVMLSVALLTSQGRKYASDYWHQIVEATGARRVYIIHYDDFTKPFGQTELFPTSLDNVVESAQWLNVLAKSGDGNVALLRPLFGEPIVLY